jgi:hypothetical protein
MNGATRFAQVDAATRLLVMLESLLDRLGNRVPHGHGQIL